MKVTKRKTLGHCFPNDGKHTTNEAVSKKKKTKNNSNLKYTKPLLNLTANLYEMQQIKKYFKHTMGMQLIKSRLWETIR